MAIFDFPKMKNSESSDAYTATELAKHEPLSLLLRLQQSLDAAELIEAFSQQIDHEIGLDGYAYTHAPEAIACRSGHQNRHGLAYSVKFEDDDLGEIKLYRAKPFSEAECRRIEDLLSLSTYPLRNALRYQAALRSAYTDPLTGLCNRSNMLQQLQREISLSRRENRPMSLAIVDIDHFKHVNDRFGHLSGDQVILCVSRQLRQYVRDFDLIFRYGGEEFVIVLSGTNGDCALNIAERLRLAVSAHTCTMQNGDTVSPTVSIGVSELRNGESPLDLFARTDRAMYEAKSRGRNTSCLL